MSTLHVSIAVLYLLFIVASLFVLKLFQYVKSEGERKQANQERTAPPDIGLDIGSILLLDSMESYDHGMIHFDDHRPRLLAFSMVGCKSCEDTYQSLQRFAELHPDLHILLFLFALEQEEATSTIQEKKLHDFPVVWLQESMLDTFKVKSFPFAYFMSNENVIINKQVVNNYEHLEELVDVIPSLPMNRTA